MFDARQIEGMTREEKLQAMEALWADLARDPSTVDSPAWHADELKATEARVASGEERITDWSSAKAELRQQFQ